MDVHDAKGLQVEREVKRLMNELGHSDAIIFTHGMRIGIARSERAKARERRKRAEKHRQTKDLFSK